MTSPIHSLRTVFSSRSTLADGLRFLLAGGANTLLTLGVYQLLLIWLSPDLSYALCWLVGLVFLLIVYPSKVFVGSGSNVRRGVTTILVYAIVFGLSWLLLRGLVAQGLHPRLAIFLVLVFSTGVNFLLMRLIYRGSLALPKPGKHD